MSWADLDDCNPAELEIEPTITVESSPQRWQAYWKFEEPVNALEAEDISKRIAYAHAHQGADKSGWDLTQVLRVPGTKNFKRAREGRIDPVKIVGSNMDQKLTPASFDVYPKVDGFSVEFEAMPDIDTSGPEVLERVRTSIHPKVWTLFESPPETDWSKSLWQLEQMLIDFGLTKEEVYVVARDSACNKYKRDGRKPELLWKEVCRAWDHYHNQAPVQVPESDDLLIDELPLLTAEEREWCAKNPTIVEEYIEWAKTIGDAAWQYHQAGAFVILSTLLAGTVRLPTSFGTVLPNLWFMILADTTLTRKTTAMDMGVDLLQEIDSDCILATDGSIEGLLTSLSMRPGRPSVFLRDEFSGLLEMLTKRDYYAGMLETLTKLYDGKFQKRVLRKETLEVRDPVLILFAGGIRERMLSLFTPDHVNSGFMPRFVFITAESDVTKLRPLGPPTERSMGKRHELVSKFRKMHQHYTAIPEPEPGKIALPPTWEAQLTEEAWVRYNKIENAMLEAGLKSNQPDLMTPTLDRLCKSGLKASVLLAAARCDPVVTVTEEDLVRAFWYVEQWRGYTFEVISKIGQSSQERILERIHHRVKKHPGIFRSQIMQSMHLTAREADLHFTTLEQRGLIVRTREGKGEKLHPTGT